jgi:DNA-binding IclR family transcriptional regulator
LGKLDFETPLVVNQVELAKRLKMQRTNVNRAIKRLVALEVLIEGPKTGPLRTYRLNPSFGWKGSAKNHQNVVKLDQKKKTSKASKKED